MTGIVTQGFKSNSNASLDGLLTLVVISHVWPALLRRTLQHYSTFTGSIQVLDSSAVANASIRQDFPAVAYQHLPQFGELSTQEKLAHSVQQVATPYMVFAVDNDFLLDDALGQCVDFLEGNPDHGLCHGYSLSYLSTGKQVNYYRRDKRFVRITPLRTLGSVSCTSCRTSSRRSTPLPARPCCAVGMRYCQQAQAWSSRKWATLGTCWPMPRHRSCRSPIRFVTWTIRTP